MTTKPLLDFIAEHESETTARRLGISAYNVVWGGIRKADHPPKPLVAMTIRQVLSWQDQIDPRYRSEAAGRYQILEDTLRGLYEEAGLGIDDLFSAANQDRLAEALLRHRGLQKYLSGSITEYDFANNLAKEWASLPCVTGPKKGRSYYSGDGLNAALVDVEPFLAAVRACSSNEHQPVNPGADPDSAPPAPGPWAAIVAFVASIATIARKGA